MRQASIPIAISLLAAGILPALINPWGYNAFETPKVVLLRGLILAGGLIALIQATGKGNNFISAYLDWKRFPLLLPVVLFGAVMLLATIFSVNPLLSWWGSYQRQQGLLAWMAYLGLFLLTAANLRTRQQIKRLWLFLAWGSAPVVLYGLLQAAGLDLFTWRTDGVSTLVSTFGRANFFASYLVLVIPLTVYLLVTSARRWHIALLLSVQLTCLVLTQARGAWLGFGASALTFGLLWAITGKKRQLLTAILLVTVLALALLGVLNISGSPLAALSALPGLDRLSRLSNTNAGSVAARVTIWKATLALIANRPWLGYGPDTMQTVFERVFPPQLVYYQGRHITVDRAHNIWLDMAMTAGAAGVTAFGLILLEFGRLLWRELRQTTDPRLQLQWIALASAITGYLVDMQFGFTTTPVAAFFWLVLALAVGMYRAGRVQHSFNSQAEPHIKISAGQKTLYVFSTAFLLALLFLLCVRPLLADFAFWKAQNAHLSVDERYAAGLRAVQLLPTEPEYRFGLALIEQRRNNFAAAEAQLEAVETLAPNTPRLWAARGNLYARWGAVQPGYYRQAEAAYRQAVALSPNRAAYYTALGVILARQGNYETGAAAIERAVELDATDITAYRHLADLYTGLGRQSDAARARSQALYWAQKTGEDERNQVVFYQSTE